MINFLLNILSIAYLATYSGVNDFKLNLTFARRLKLVSTGPGHKTDITLSSLFLLSYSYKAT